MTTGQRIEQADIMLIGGSGTWAAHFPEEIPEPGVHVASTGHRFETPYGPTAPLKLLEVECDDGTRRRCWRVPMHGLQPGVPERNLEQAEAIFWVAAEAGVRKILVDGSVGGINTMLEVGDIVVPHDFIDRRTRTTRAFQGDVQVRMRQALCPSLRADLIEAAEGLYRRVMRRSVYIAAEGPRFESPAEIAMFRQWGADIVGQTLTPEVYLARAIGACIGGVYIVSNPAEDPDTPWTLDDMRTFYRTCAPTMGQVTLRALKRLRLHAPCGCGNLRTTSLADLLKDR